MKISIITVTYNAASVLKRTLDSVKAQSWQQIEHLIIDGASKDETISMAETYKAQCPYEVVILSEPDKGLYDAMNKGLRLATGDYLVFLNAGDTLHAADTLETIVRSAQPLPGVLYGDTAITDEQGNFLHLRRLRPPKKLSWKSFRQGMLVCHQAFYALTDIAKNLPYDPRYRYSADVDWCIRVMKEAQKRQLPLVNTQAILADYQEEGQTTIHHRDSDNSSNEKGTRRSESLLFSYIKYHLFLKRISAPVPP